MIPMIYHLDGMRVPSTPARPVKNILLLISGASAAGGEVHWQILYAVNIVVRQTKLNKIEKIYTF